MEFESQMDGLVVEGVGSNLTRPSHEQMRGHSGRICIQDKHLKVDSDKNKQMDNHI